MQDNIVFFGSSAYVLPILETLQKNFSLVFVVTTEKKETDAVPSFCVKKNISYVSVDMLTVDVEEKIKNCHAQVAVLADFGIIVSKKIIDLFPKGIINIHPSLLPKYRGATPVQTAILNGDEQTGISIMLLAEKLDAGPILYQQEEPILETDNTKTLYEKLFTIGAQKLPKILEAYMQNTLKPKPQEDAKATFTKTLTKESGFIDIKNSPNNLTNMIRAFYPWPGVWTKMTLFGKEKIVKLLPAGHPELDSGSILLQVEGKKPMAPKDFLNGYPEAKETLHNLHVI